MRRLHFDKVARLYEASRPGYPELLAGVAPGGAVIDIGCGTGKSTEPFARRGLRVCALHPGENMLAVCREKLRSYPGVTFRRAAFETRQPGGPYMA